MTSKRGKNKLDEEGDDSSGQGSGIEFRDFMTGLGSQRDDQLPPDELKRILLIHGEAQEERVKKQKELRDQRKDLKSGKISLDAYRQEKQAGMRSQYPPHPALSNKAQFSGIDKQNNPMPTENNAQTNEANRNELELQYRLQHQPQLAQKFHPKPQLR